MTIMIWIIKLLLVPALSPLFVGLTRKIKAKFQNRQGASVLQPYRDLWKLFQKDEVVSHDSSWIFLYAPYLIFAVTLVIGASVPALFYGLQADLLTVVYLIALSTFFLALAGLDTGGGFGGFGSSREMMVAALTEGGLVLSLLTLALISKSTNLDVISASIAALPATQIAPVIFAFISFAISMLAETARYPFDNPATHLELTMIHEAMILEYSGKRLALIEWASANKYLIFMILGANLFFPWGIFATGGVLAILVSFVTLLVKISVFAALVAILESTVAKFRIFRLPDLLFTSFIISIIAIGFIII